MSGCTRPSFRDQILVLCEPKKVPVLALTKLNPITILRFSLPVVHRVLLMASAAVG